MYSLVEKIEIKNMIYEIRGKKVMLDADLARLYGYKSGAKALNQAVKRNIERFPEDFSFELTKDEYNELMFNSNFLRSQTVTLKENQTGKHKKYLPRVFTQEGIAMLSSVIRTKEASEVNVEIMREFVKLRSLVNNNSISLANDISVMKNMLFNHEEKISELFDKFDKKEDLKSKLFFNGEIYDAYSLLVDIIGQANKEIIIIDNYIDKVTLDILSKKKVNTMVLLITDKSKSKIIKTDIEKFNRQYPKLHIKYTNSFHDRFIILDNKELYHLGASLKDLGKRVFGITKINECNTLHALLNKIKFMKS